MTADQFEMLPVNTRDMLEELILRSIQKWNVRNLSAPVSFRPFKWYRFIFNHTIG